MQCLRGCWEGNLFIRAQKVPLYKYSTMQPVSVSSVSMVPLQCNQAQHLVSETTRVQKSTDGWNVHCNASCISLRYIPVFSIMRVSISIWAGLVSFLKALLAGFDFLHTLPVVWKSWMILETVDLSTPRFCSLVCWRASVCHTILHLRSLAYGVVHRKSLQLALSCSPWISLIFAHAPCEFNIHRCKNDCCNSLYTSGTPYCPQ